MQIETLQKFINEANKIITKKYGEYQAVGLYRYVYFSKKFVIKVPKNVEGFISNYREESLGSIKLKSNALNKIYATCKLVHI